jgi:hypothetical protein
MTATGIQTTETEIDLDLLRNPWLLDRLVRTEYLTEKGRTCHDRGEETHMFLGATIVGGVVTVVTVIEAGIAIATLTEVDVVDGGATVKETEVREGGRTVTVDHKTEDPLEGKNA